MRSRKRTASSGTTNQQEGGIPRGLYPPRDEEEEEDDEEDDDDEVDGGLLGSAAGDTTSPIAAATDARGRVDPTLLRSVGTDRDDNDIDDGASLSSEALSSEASSLRLRPPPPRRVVTMASTHAEPSSSSSWHTNFFASPRTTVLARSPRRTRLRRQRRRKPHDGPTKLFGLHSGEGESNDDDSVDEDDDFVNDDSAEEDYDDGSGHGHGGEVEAEEAAFVNEDDNEHNIAATDGPVPRRRTSPSASARGSSFARRFDGLHQRRRNDPSSLSSLLPIPPPGAPLPTGASSSSPYRTNPHHPLQPAHYRGKLVHPALLKRQASSQSTTNKSSNPLQRFSFVWSSGYYLHVLLAAVAISYAVLAWHVVYHRTPYGDPYYYQTSGPHSVVAWQYQLEKRRLARAFLDRKQTNRRHEAQRRGHHRALQRHERTVPPPFAATVANAPELRALSPVLKDADFPIGAWHDTTATTPHLLATMEDLCGYYAQNASLAVPALYPRRDALGGEGTSRRPARVVITGILNPLGYHLALTLRERCGVNSLVGIDHLFPNTAAARLHKVEQIQVLTTRLEGVLERPILSAYAALEPSKSGVGDGAVYLDTGELDLVQTFHPTHVVHLAAYGPEVYRTTVRNDPSPYVSSPDHPSLYSLRSSLTSLEHIVRSVAAAPEEDRPHVLYLSSPASPQYPTTDNGDKFLRLHRSAREMDEIVARSYHERYGVYSTSLRIPDAVFGPWGHPESATYRMFEAAADTTAAVAATTPIGDNDDQPLDSEDPVVGPDTSAATSSSFPNSLLHLVYVADAVEGLVAAMQLRPPDGKPLTLELLPTAALSVSDLHREVRAALATTSDSVAGLWWDGAGGGGGATPFPVSVSSAAYATRRYLEWSPSTSLREGLVRTLAWHLDRANRYGESPRVRRDPNNSTALGNVPPTGDTLLERHGAIPCSPDDAVCHGGPSFLPCASECATRARCTPSVFDGMVTLMHEVLEGCDVVLYTQALDHDDELTLETEYMEEGNPLVCTVAFVNFESPFVQTVVKKVPDAELVKLGVAPRHEDGGTPEGIHKLKKEKLNGRLLYLGWLLVWPDDVPDRLSHADKYLLKLSPGRIFPPELKHGVFIEQSFGASPRTDDVYFLLHALTRPAVPVQLVKSKTPPKIKFRLPPEPPKRAVILLSELRRQESSKSSRTYSDSKLSVRQASRYMRFELGEDPVGKKESLAIKQQREFYERVTTLLNANTMRSPAEPLYKFELKQLARTRWVVHDLRAEEGRQLRCDWYQEHVQWKSPLDQLSLAFVMAKRELERRIAHQEIDDRVKMTIASTIEKKKLLTDVFEWHPLRTEVNRHYSPFAEVEEVRVVDVPTVDTDDNEGDEGGEQDTNELLFARIISDRYLSAARKSWNVRKKT